MSNRLEDQPYYHGIRKREDIEDELKENGDFLVRASQSLNKTRIVLNVQGKRQGKSGQSNVLLAFSCDTKKYYLRAHKSRSDRKEFDSIPELVTYFQQEPLPNGVRLKRPVNRPQWLIKHTVIQYDEKRDKLGEGNFSTVYKGRFVDTQGQVTTVAIKACHQESANADQQEANEARASMMSEAKLMSGLKHPNVTTFFGVACDHPPVLIVMEFCAGGSLDNHLRKYVDISPMELTLFCFEITRGMRYLHSQLCIHRDLAARNCLISSKGIVKIADFGLSKIISDLQQGKSNLKNVPLKWMAPECLTKKPLYSTASDVWAFGVVVFEIFNKGVPPWSNEPDVKTIAKKIRAFELPEFPTNASEFMKKLVVDRIWKEAGDRISFKDLLEQLLDYVLLNLYTFPPIQELTVNKISGVQRSAIISETKQQVLAEPVVATKKKTRRSRVSDPLSGSNSQTRSNSAESTQRSMMQRSLHSVSRQKSSKSSERDEFRD